MRKVWRQSCSGHAIPFLQLTSLSYRTVLQKQQRQVTCTTTAAFDLRLSRDVHHSCQICCLLGTYQGVSSPYQQPAKTIYSLLNNLQKSIIWINLLHYNTSNSIAINISICVGDTCVISYRDNRYKIHFNSLDAGACHTLLQRFGNQLWNIDNLKYYSRNLYGEYNLG